MKMTKVQYEAVMQAMKARLADPEDGASVDADELRSAVREEIGQHLNNVDDIDADTPAVVAALMPDFNAAVAAGEAREGAANEARYAPIVAEFGMPTDIAGLPVHPLANCFPMIKVPSVESLSLRADIHVRGLIDPVVLLDGAILDGRNRAVACAALGIDPKTVEFSTLGLTMTPADFVKAKNIERRQLTKDQRTAAIWKLGQYVPVSKAAAGKAGGTAKAAKPSSGETTTATNGAPKTTKTRDKLAKAAGVGESKAQDAINVGLADPSAIDGVIAGTTTLAQEAKKLKAAKAKPIEPAKHAVEQPSRNGVEQKLRVDNERLQEENAKLRSLLRDSATISNAIAAREKAIPEAIRAGVEKEVARLTAGGWAAPKSWKRSPRFKQLLQLCHPDKHNGSSIAVEVTQWLLNQREA